MKISTIKKYFWNVLISIDQLGNTIFLAGDPDETISSNLGKYERAGTKNKILLWLIHTLDKIDPQHCADSIEEDEGKDAIIKVRVKKK